MVKHMIIWKIDDKYSTAQKEEILNNAKRELEGLKGKIEGLVDISLQIEKLETSNADMMLDSLFESFEALKGYAVHPLHVAVADNFIRPFTATRLCMDFEN